MKLIVDDYSRGARCEACKLPPGLCICAELPAIALPVRLVLIEHPRERHSQSNTAHLVHRVFANSELRDYRDLMCDDGAESLWDEATEYRVLFPQADATVVSPETFSAGRPSALVVFNGTWRQARRMSRRVPGVRAFPFVTLPDEPRRRAMRRPRRPGQRSTGEAVGRALELLGYEEEVQPFREALEQLVARALHVRGKFSRRRVLASPPVTR